MNLWTFSSILGGGHARCAFVSSLAILAKFLEKVISILLEMKILSEKIRYPFVTFTQEIPLGWLIVQQKAS